MTAELERAPRQLGRPALEHAPGNPRRFVAGTLVAAAALLLAVLSFDVVVDPWGQLGTGIFPSLIPTDRPVKIALIDRLPKPPQLARSIPFERRWSARVHGILPLLSWKGLRASIRVFRKTEFGNGIPLRNALFTANGFRRYDIHDIARANGSSFADQLRASENLYAWVYRRLYHGLSRTQQSYFEDTLAKMDAWGSPPVIVLTPIHPAMRAFLGPLGWNARYRQVLAYLHALSTRYRFSLVDMTSISSFGGSPRLFYDGFHLTVPNVHRLLDTLVRKERRAL